MNTDVEDSELDQKRPRSNPLVRNTGVVLILLSGVFFFTMLAVPWFPISATRKAWLAGGLFVGVQVSWWVGAAMVGPAAVKKIRSLFSGKKNDGD